MEPNLKKSVYCRISGYFLFCITRVASLMNVTWCSRFHIFVFFIIPYDNRNKKKTITFIFIGLLWSIWLHWQLLNIVIPSASKHHQSLSWVETCVFNSQTNSCLIVFVFDSAYNSSYWNKSQKQNKEVWRIHTFLYTARQSTRTSIDGNYCTTTPHPTPNKEVIPPRQGALVCFQNNSINYGWILMKLQEMLTMAPSSLVVIQVTTWIQEFLIIFGSAGTMFANFGIIAHWLIADQRLVKFKYNQ